MMKKCCLMREREKQKKTTGTILGFLKSQEVMTEGAFIKNSSLKMVNKKNLYKNNSLDTGLDMDGEI